MYAARVAQAAIYTATSSSFNWSPRGAVSAVCTCLRCGQLVSHATSSLPVSQSAAAVPDAFVHQWWRRLMHCDQVRGVEGQRIPPGYPAHLHGEQSLFSKRSLAFMLSMHTTSPPNPHCPSPLWRAPAKNRNDMLAKALISAGSLRYDHSMPSRSFGATAVLDRTGLVHSIRLPLIVVAHD